jgi:hypothetical protein
MTRFPTIPNTVATEVTESGCIIPERAVRSVLK